MHRFQAPNHVPQATFSDEAELARLLAQARHGYLDADQVPGAAADIGATVLAPPANNVHANVLAPLPLHPRALGLNHHPLRVALFAVVPHASPCSTQPFPL